MFRFGKLAAVPLAAMGMAACSQVSLPTTEEYRSALVAADTPLKRCLLAAEFGETAPDFMRLEDLQAGYNANKRGERMVRVNNEISIGYAGYSARAFSHDYFQRAGDPLRARMYRAYETAQLIDTEDDDFEILADVGGIDMAENAMLALDSGDVDCATVLFEEVQKIDELGEADSRFSRFFSDDILLGYEQVMLYNYRALGYMLAGDRKAIPATLAAAARMEANREKYGDELAKLKAERQKKAREARGGSPLIGFFLGGNFVQLLQRLNDFQYSQRAGARIASPYLNPLSNYIRAVMAETEAVQDPQNKSTEWNTARIAWQQATQLLPKNQFLRKSLSKVQDYRRNGIPAGTKLVHVVAASGYAPRKKLIEFVRQTGKCTPFIFNIDALTPVSTRDFGVVADAGDGQIRPLELMADIEAMAFRYQQDRVSDRITTRGIIAVTSYIASSAIEGDGSDPFACILGAVASVAANEATKASTKSWTTLPAKLRAIRLEVPVETQSISLGLQGPGGSVAGWAEFDLLAEDTTVIYARIIDGKLWGSAQNTPFGSGRIKPPSRPTPSQDVAERLDWSIGR